MKARMFFTLYFVMVLVGIGTCLGLDVYTKESLEFIDCSFNESERANADYITLVVKNTGTTDLAFVELTLNSRQYVRHDEFDYPPPPFVEPISPGETKSIRIHHHWDPHYFYVITLITKRGNAFSTIEISPERQLPLEIDTVTWNRTSNTVSVVVRNMGTKERKINYLGLSESLYGGCHVIGHYSRRRANEIYVAIDQKATIVADWPSDWSPWISDKTYYFYIHTEPGPDTTFTSRPP